MQVPIWQGFDHHWQLEPHRLNRFASCIDIDEATSSVREVHGHYQSAMQIGRFPPDTCHTHAMIHGAGSESTGLIEGSVRAMLGGVVGEAASWTGEVIHVPLPADNLAATVILRGFDVDCHNFRSGFQTRGFGFMLEDIKKDTCEGQPCLSFVPRITIHTDRSPDPFTDPRHLIWKLLPRPKGLGPQTPVHYEYEMTLHYSVIYDQPANLNVTHHSVEETVLSTRRRNDALATVQGAGDDDYPVASLGIRGFRWELLPWDWTRRDGRYLRKLTMIIDGMSYSSAAGEMVYVPKMEFTNYGGRQGREQVKALFTLLRSWQRSGNGRIKALARSLRFSYQFKARYTLHTSLLQFNSDRQVTVGRLYQPIRREPEVAQPFHLTT